MLRTPFPPRFEVPLLAEQRSSITWAKRLKRVFNIDIETCSKCGGEVKLIASIENPTVIRKIGRKTELSGYSINP
jgi:hypothetical protein